MKFAILTFLSLFTVGSIYGAEAPVVSHTDGAWVSREKLQGAAKLRVEVDSIKPGVSVIFNREKKFTPSSIEMTFIDHVGRKTPVTLRTMDPMQNIVRYEGSLTKSESFVGFQITIPFYSQPPVVIDSHQMIEVEE